MSSQAWAQGQDTNCIPPAENRDDIDATSKSAWQVWKQVIIGELLNVLERRRYDHAGPR